jgi:hypothetical protein
MAKSEGKQKISFDGKGKESMDNTGGWPKPCFRPLKGCLVNICPQPGFKHDKRDDDDESIVV